MDVSLNEVMESPSLLPIGANIAQNKMHFIKMSRRGYLQSSFLDAGRAVSEDHEHYETELDVLLSFPRPLFLNHTSYILHGAFCCSTLLTRYLDLLPSCFSLREPPLLTQLASLKLKEGIGSGDKTAGRSEQFQKLFQLAITLLTRSYEKGEMVIIKPNDLGNVLATMLYENDTGCRMLFLGLDLRSFLLATLKSEFRRSWIRRRLETLYPATVKLPVLGAVHPRLLSDAAACAYLWLLNNAFYDELRSHADPHRILALDGAQIANDPQKSLALGTSFFGLSVDGQQLRKVLEDPSAGRYSKDLSLPYDVQTRHSELKMSAQLWTSEVDDGVQWVLDRLPQLSFRPHWPIG